MSDKKTIPELLDELSFLSRETTGASFCIQHIKDTGKYKVVFNNAMTQMKHDPLKQTDFESCLTEAIDWIRVKRKPVEVPTEKYTMF